jgi:poly(A) polymerase
MAEVLPAQPWMIDPATRAVMAALERAGGADCARFVGGCVRNALLGAPVADIDIATTLTPPAVTRALTDAGLKAVPTGIDHGTITAVAYGRPFEITTLRRDVETDGRRAVVAFTTDWGEDAARRDFRLNALYADTAGRLFDPTGAGLADARAGAIVFVGDAATRIREDALRIVRYFRFLAWYGRETPDPAALAACREGRDLLAGLSAERIGHELTKLLAAPDPRLAVRLMAETGVLERLAPGAGDLRRLDTLISLAGAPAAINDPILRLAALLPGDPDRGRAVATGLRLANVQRDRLIAALGEGPALGPAMSPGQVRRAVWTLGAETFADRALLTWAGSDDPGDSAAWREVLALARAWRRPAPPLTGEAILAAGLTPGPKVGEILRTVEAWWIDNDFFDDPPALAARLEAAIGEVAGRRPDGGGDSDQSPPDAAAAASIRP